MPLHECNLKCFRCSISLFSCIIRDNLLCCNPSGCGYMVCWILATLSPSLTIMLCDVYIMLLGVSDGIEWYIYYVYLEYVWNRNDLVLRDKIEVDSSSYEPVILKYIQLKWLNGKQGTIKIKQSQIYFLSLSIQSRLRNRMGWLWGDAYLPGSPAENTFFYIRLN